MSNTTDLANAFMEMSKAVAKVPELEARVKELEDALAHANEEIGVKSGTITKLQDDVNLYVNEVNDLEAQLKDARFREELASETLDKVKGVMAAFFPEPKPIELPTTSNEPVAISREDNEPKTEPVHEWDRSNDPVPSPIIPRFGDSDQPDLQPRPYAGKPWYERPDNVTITEWIDGGGNDY